MRLNKEWRKYAKCVVQDGIEFWFHPKLPSQSEYVAEFLISKGFDLSQTLHWREWSFYILHGFLIDCEANESPLAVYIEEIDGLPISEAFDKHMSHPLLDDELAATISRAFKSTRDRSLEAQTIDKTADEEEVEKKEIA